MNIQIDSEEVNYLIYRYLLEAGMCADWHLSFLVNNSVFISSSSHCLFTVFFYLNERVLYIHSFAFFVAS